MTENTENIINKFIKTEFPIKKIRNENKKWTRAIIIPEGYIRMKSKTYYLSNRIQFNSAFITDDILEIVSYFFGFGYNETKPLVLKYIKSIRI